MHLYIAAADNGPRTLGLIGILVSTTATLLGSYAAIVLEIFSTRFRHLSVDHVQKDLEKAIEGRESREPLLVSEFNQAAENESLAVQSSKALTIEETEQSPGPDEGPLALPGAALPPVAPQALRPLPDEVRKELKYLAERRRYFGREHFRNQTSLSQLYAIRETAQMSETRSLFRHARLAFYFALLVAAAAAGTLLYGLGLAVVGHIASGVIVSLSSAVPGGISAGLYRISQSSYRRADKAFEMLSEAVAREGQIERIVQVSHTVADEGVSESIRTLAALKAAFPDASAKDLEGLLQSVRATPQLIELPPSPDQG